MVRGEWSVPRALEARLVRSGLHVPQPVPGLLLIDTGASHTCIGEDVAQALGLRPTSVGVTYGAGGRHQSPEYLAHLSFGVPVGHGQYGTISREQTSMAVPDLDLQFARVQQKELPAGVVWRLTGIIGRDILRNMLFAYDGPGGSFTLSVP